MIDTAVILFSTLMCLFILLRAIRLDGLLPWFATKKSRRWDGLADGTLAEGADDVP